MTTRAAPYSNDRSWVQGVDSFSRPDALGPQEVVMAMNCALRGELIQSRPGSKSLFCLPVGRPQGGIVFTPPSGVAHIVVAVDGLIYTSASPFREWSQLPNVQFSPSSRYVTFASCLKSTDYTAGGELFFLDVPYRVLIIQDGRTRAAYWDGGSSGHMNPTPSGGELTQADRDGTKIGLFMAWSGSRLWVSRGSQIFASDIGNPQKFTEAQYLNEAPAFYLPAECTGIIETPEKDGIIAFHAEGGDFFQSSILDRTAWLQTDGFQRTVVSVPNVAPRSLIKQHGFVWWYSPAGLMTLNEAQRVNVSSEITPVDQEMAWSKARIGPDLSGIACTAFENYLLVSVPWCSRYNTHTWAMDLSTFENNQRSWNGVWTGWRPVEWMTGMVDGRNRCFCLSADTDGNNRVWEMFLADRKDNGCAITSSVQFRLDSLGSGDRKKYQFAELDLGQVLGDVSIMAAVAGQRGWFQRIMTKEIVASEGRIDTDDRYGDGTTAPLMGGNRPQVRTIKTEVWTNPDACNECGVESTDQNNIDTHFQLFVAWSGRAGIMGVRQFATDFPRDQHGGCEPNESGFHTLMETGCASLDQYPSNEPFPSFLGTGTVNGEGVRNGAEVVNVTARFGSQISLANANRVALCHATQQFNRLAYDPTIDINTDISYTSEWLDVTLSNPSLQDLEVYNENGVLVGDAFDVGPVISGDYREVSLRITNVGGRTLTLGLPTIDGLYFSIVASLNHVQIAPGDYALLTLHFSGSPLSEDVFTGELSLPSDDPDGTRVIALTGGGPQIWIYDLHQ